MYKIILSNCIPLNGTGRNWPQILAVILAGSGGISTAALYSWTSPSIPILTSNASHISIISLEQASYFTVIPSSAAIIATPLLAAIVNTAGRKFAILLMIVLHILSWILKIIATSLIVLYLSSVAEGLSNAVMVVVVPMYLGEVAQPKIRVVWGNSYPLFAYLGQFVINVVGSIYDIPTTAYIMLCVPILQFILVLFIPESPYFLLKQNKRGKAENSLKILRWKVEVDEELDTIDKSIHGKEELGTYRDLFFSSINRKILIIVSTLRIFQQFSGIRTFFMYSQYIFNQAGSNISASTSAIIFTSLFLLSAVIFNFFVGSFNRRTLLVSSCLGCGVSLAIVGIYFYLLERNAINLSSVTWIPLAGMILYIPFSITGLGTLPSVMVGELFPLSIKDKAIGVVNMIYFVFIIVSSKIFQLLSDNYGIFSSFWLFSACCFPGALFCYRFVPETRGKTLEEIQDDLHRST